MSFKKAIIAGMFVLPIMAAHAADQVKGDVVSIEPGLMVIYDAHKFNKEAKVVSDLVKSGDLVDIPPMLKPYLASIQLTPTSVEIPDVSKDFCQQQAPVVDADKGVAGMQCVHDETLAVNNDEASRSDKKNSSKKKSGWTLVYRKDVVHPWQKGFWQWHTVMQTSGDASRMVIKKSDKIVDECQGKVLTPGRHVMVGSNDFCLPVFDGQIDPKLTVGPYYASQGEKQFSFTLAGQHYVLIFAAGGISK